MPGKNIKAKYAIDAELLPYCISAPRLPGAFVLPVQKMLRMSEKKHLRDDRIEYEIFRLESGVRMIMLKPKGCLTKKALYDIHGGGFIYPHAPYHIELAKEYAFKLNARVFLIDYRLAPKYPYPAAPCDCFTGYEFLRNNAKTLGIDTDNLIVCGDSAGGYLAADVCLKSHKKYGTVPKGNVLLYPVCDFRTDTESMKKYTDTPMCNSRDAEYYNKLFTKGRAVTLMNEDLSVMPATYIEVAEFDCLRDCALAYAQRLKDLGIRTELHDVAGAMHGFDSALQAKITEKCVENRIAFINSLF